MRGLQSTRTWIAATLAWAVASAFPAAGISAVSPVLEMAPPEIDQNTLRVAVRVKNRGSVALPPSDLIVRYTVSGVTRGARPPLAEGTFEVADLSIPPGASAEVGHFVLPDPDRALSFEHVTVSLRAEPRKHGRFEIVEASFPHRWHETTVSVTSARLGTLGASCSLSLENQDSGPRRGQSAITLRMGPRAVQSALELPRPCAIASGGREGPPPWGALLVAGLSTGPPSRSHAISIRDGKLLIRMELGASCSDEIRVVPVHSGHLGTPHRNVADVRPFTVEVELIPAASADCRRISYGHLPTVSIGRIVTVPAAGPLPAEDVVEAAVEACIRGPLLTQLARVFDRSEVRAVIEELLTAAADGRRIHFIRRVTGHGDAILVTYV